MKKIAILLISLLLICTMSACELPNPAGSVPQIPDWNSNTLDYVLCVGTDGVYYTLEGPGDCLDSSIIIASEIDGIPVKRISEGAFYENTQITEVYIPDGIDTIESSAFYGCRNLKKVVIAGEVTHIGSSAFGSCEALSEVFCSSPEQPEGWAEDWKDSHINAYWGDSWEIIEGVPTPQQPPVNELEPIVPETKPQPDPIIPTEPSQPPVEDDPQPPIEDDPQPPVEDDPTPETPGAGWDDEIEVDSDILDFDNDGGSGTIDNSAWSD